MESAELDRMQTQAQLETLMRLFISAVNRRDFDTDSLIWTRVAEDFVGFIDPRLPMQGPGGLRETYMEAVRVHPNLEVDISEMISDIDEAGGTATLFWIGTAKGFYTDLTICSTGTAGFKRVEGQWYISCLEGARGLKNLAS